MASPNHSFSGQNLLCCPGDPLPNTSLPPRTVLFLASPASRSPDFPPSPAPTGRAPPRAGAAGPPCAAPPHLAAARCHAPGAPRRGTRHTWQFRRPHSKTPSSGGKSAPVKQWLDTKLLCLLPSCSALLALHLPGAFPTWTTYPERHPLSPTATWPLPQPLLTLHPKSWPHWACLGPPCLHGWGRRGGGQPLR